VINLARRRRRSRAQNIGRWLVPLALALITGLCAWGFVSLTRIALYRQAHGVPGAEHPYDWQADGCLALAMLAGGVLLLARPLRAKLWRKTRSRTRVRAGAAKRRGRVQ